MNMDQRELILRNVKKAAFFSCSMESTAYERILVHCVGVHNIMQIYILIKQTMKEMHQVH